MTQNKDTSTLDVEHRILGVLIDDKSKQGTILSRVEAHHFNDDTTRLIFKKILELKKRKIDIDTFSVSNALKNKLSTYDILNITNKADHTTNIESVILALIQNWSFNELTKTMFYLNESINEDDSDPFNIIDQIKSYHHNSQKISDF